MLLKIKIWKETPELPDQDSHIPFYYKTGVQGHGRVFCFSTVTFIIIIVVVTNTIYLSLGLRLAKKTSLYLFKQCLRPEKAYKHNNQHPTSLVSSSPHVLSRKVSNQLLNGKDKMYMYWECICNFFSHT